MNAKQIRRKFLNFFETKQHQIVPSAPLVNKDDPTLMFTNAGMNQFKDYFLGSKAPKFNRVADTQKCLRVSGKHNDLEEVGLDTYHHTFFEMLGNWSFGDYFKKEAIDWAWELLTKEYGLDPDRLYVSVFGGDKEDKLDIDQEAYDLWSNIVDKDRIIHGSKKDNFWEMGDTGPCGPCSEIHIDLRSDADRKEIAGKDLVNQDHPLVVEIWNLVFMEFNRMASGELVPLPAKHVDTGMGFERLCMAIQHKASNYDTDVFTPLIEALEKSSNVKYGVDQQTDVALRVVSDHVRAVAFAIADGQLPSNNGAGYVIRRILRRGIRYGFTYLNQDKPFIHTLVPILVKQFEDVFPEVKNQQEFITSIVRKEEESFLKTLDSGIFLLNNEITRLVVNSELPRFFNANNVGVIGPQEGWNTPDFTLSEYDLKIQIRGDLNKGINAEKQIDNNVMREISVGDILQSDIGELLSIDTLKGKRLIPQDKIDGSVAFKLYDTHGFPLDLTVLIAKENGFNVDIEGFNKAMAEQKNRSKADAVQETGDWHIVQEGEPEFVGYDSYEAKSGVLRHRELKHKGKSILQLVLDKTPFYAESGGQVGDTGVLVSDNEKIRVLDTKKENDLIVHFVDKLPTDMTLPFTAHIDDKKRKLTMNNHTATHLLHAALREVLGDHVEQRGSLVNDKILRFDFSHFQKMTEEEIHDVERIVNEKVRSTIDLDEKRNVPIAEAKKMGATALFGEKYGDFVRVITFDPNYSVELCGGTHVKNTGAIGLFKITSEGSIAAGIRRIEAVTAARAEAFVDEQLQQVKTIKEMLKQPKDITGAVNNLLAQKADLEKQLDGLKKEQAKGVKSELIEKIKEVDGINTLITKVALPDADSLKQLSFELRNEVENLAMVLAADIDGKPQISVVFDESLTKSKEWHAGNLVRELAKEIKGGGGGQPFFATAGGKDLSGLDKVVEKAKEFLNA